MKKSKFDFKKFGLRTSNLIILSLICILVGFVLIVATYGFNELDYSGDVYTRTAALLSKESDYKKVTIHDNSALDNFTDSLMILTAMHPNKSGDSLVASAMKNSRTQLSGSPRKAFEGDISKGKDYEYSRYWHGYLIFLKPLLKYFDFSQIRIINAMFQGCLLFALIAILFKKKYGFVIIPFLCAYALISPLTIASSMQYSSAWNIVLISSIVYLLLQNKIIEHNLHYLYFALVGMLTSYFDLLTYPIATLGFLLIIVIATEKLTVWESIKKILICGLSWTFGYGIMWLAKILIASIVLKDSDVFGEAQKALLSRGSSNTSKGTPITDEMLYEKLSKYLTDDIVARSSIFVGITGTIYLAWTIVKNKVSKIREWLDRFKKSDDEIVEIEDLNSYSYLDSEITRNVLSIISKLIIIGALSLITIVWYKVIRQHSYVHTFMTYRTFSVMYFALFMILFKLSYDLNRWFAFKSKRGKKSTKGGTK
ncbi:MAG: hypothetical protein IKR04_07155 [Clostridia bacterium]|nr:hypothetical protein [Clostridia bacterium]